MIWQAKPFHQLTTRELYDLLQLRQQVFVVEQTCAYLDADGNDLHAWHLFAYNSDQQLVACARLFLPEALGHKARIGRVVSSPRVRGQGVGRELMHQALAFCAHHAPAVTVVLSAQTYLREFYASFGFSEIGEEYLEDDIPHIDMERRA
jgi:ElaA protein